MKTLIDLLFAGALFINALLFIPQALRIISTRCSRDISLLTFGGFLCIQLTAVLHGFLHHDYLLGFGSILSMLTCATVVVLTVIYRFRPDTSENA